MPLLLKCVVKENLGFFPTWRRILTLNENLRLLHALLAAVHWFEPSNQAIGLSSQGEPERNCRCCPGTHRIAFPGDRTNPHFKRGRHEPTAPHGIYAQRIVNPSTEAWEVVPRGGEIHGEGHRYVPFPLMPEPDTWADLLVAADFANGTLNVSGTSPHPLLPDPLTPVPLRGHHPAHIPLKGAKLRSHAHHQEVHWRQCHRQAHLPAPGPLGGDHRPDRHLTAGIGGAAAHLGQQAASSRAMEQPQGRSCGSGGLGA